MPHWPTRPIRLYPSSSDPTDEEILAPIAGLFQNSQDARRTARELLEVFGGVDGLRRASMHELTSVDGIGPATAACIHAAFLLGRRSLEMVRERLGPYRGARDVFEYLGPRLAHKEKEVFYVLLLDSKNRLIRDEVVSIGTLTASLVHPREVFRPAIRAAAAAILVAHNHPSGDCTPSREDIEVTARLRSAGELIGIPLLDHVIIGAGRYVSLAERGRIGRGR
ncbi:MAG: DNA repair protein RadC [Planctomycetota bacterium]|nr:DNA repair protein RadC [Planctomycetota bacterium]